MARRTTESISGLRRFYHQGRRAAGLIAHGKNARARLHAGANLGDVQAQRRKSRLFTRSIAHAPGESPEASRMLAILYNLDDQVAASEKHQPPIADLPIKTHVEPRHQA